MTPQSRSQHTRSVQLHWRHARNVPDAVLENHRARLEQALRDEQCDGRGELRLQLDSLSAQQELRIDGFAGRLNEATARTDQRLTELTVRTDQRLDEMTQRNELRIGEMRVTLDVALPPWPLRQSVAGLNGHARRRLAWQRVREH